MNIITLTTVKRKMKQTLQRMLASIKKNNKETTFKNTDQIK